MTITRPVGWMVLRVGATAARRVSRSAGVSISVMSSTSAATEVEGDVAIGTPAASSQAETR
jgi:hypothetical protein